MDGFQGEQSVQSEPMDISAGEFVGSFSRRKKAMSKAEVDILIEMLALFNATEPR
jgi:hypothetical protein